ncbi:hypothetical protein LEP1GSC137_4029 [Leptospira borgpetersenii str. Noumea 25]|uniref:Uncharacterized protein n=1 Tax=Leptospira borgpetersenii serovar Ballum TaxID=280505 RepID=A0A0S2ITP6_LEPBO|nr:hypothetical protein LBBP_02820 [Leptospira borgpetersenii serovar Ballum]EKQ99287.1 hypothetical protein LEP1GSC121_2606 [Leptospira borgpetersenii serovar Castellonis str. 200801910]EMO10555.1 hypothetical protein LEP1GSC137_4029 [Leptospira borgpetersenii str. Noumea 25]
MEWMKSFLKSLFLKYFVNKKGLKELGCFTGRISILEYSIFIVFIL